MLRDARTGLAVPRLRGRLHQIAFFVSIPAGIALVAMARNASGRLGAAIYAASLTGLYGTSAAYHRLARSPRARLWLRRLDHAMIFVLIAGTGTPLCLVALDGAWRVAGLTTIWTGAAIGVAVKLTTQFNYSRLTNGLYIGLGWTAVLALPQLVSELNPATLALLFAGGVLYTAGAVILLRGRPDPRPAVFGYHEVWHTLVLAAGVCHYVMNLLVVRTA